MGCTARGLKFRISGVKELHYLCSENYGADQLRGYRTADRRFCFRICKKVDFLLTRLKWFVFEPRRKKPVVVVTYAGRNSKRLVSDKATREKKRPAYHANMSV